MANKNNITKATLLTSGLSTLGIVGGVVFAVKRKSGFWGGLGWAIVGSMAGGGVGYVISSFMNFDDAKSLGSTSTSKKVKLQNLIKVANSKGYDAFEGLSYDDVYNSYFGTLDESKIDRLTELFIIGDEDKISSEFPELRG